MKKKTAIIIGSTGLIGSWVQKYLLEDTAFETVRSLVRWPAEPETEKHEIKLVDFNDPESILLALHDASVVFSALGTTQKKVNGNQKLYWQIDHDIPLRVCKMALQANCKKFIFVSSVGANAKSKNFYLRLKGQTEDDIIATGMPAVHIMQPSQLLGKRGEKRPLEALTQVVMKPLSGLLAGVLARFKAIEATTVAKAMVAVAHTEQEGVFRYTYNDMKKQSTL